MGNMIQYGVWPNCCNDCKFCLREERIPVSKKRQLQLLNAIRTNINYIDWSDAFDAGISLLGGELYHIKDIDLQSEFLNLIDDIIEKVLRVSKNPNCRFSTVTNGLYEPSFLYAVIDKISNAVGIEKVDVNFSFDLKYRFKSENDKNIVLENIKAFQKRYNYRVGVQMILTQHVINLWKNDLFDVTHFINTNIPGCNLAFLYPHPVKTQHVLPDFNFNRLDFLKFVHYLKNNNLQTYYSFLQSTKNSCSFKYTGLQERGNLNPLDAPVLSDGKELLNPMCNHSMLYKCYTDTDHCMLCDLINFDNDIIN